MQKPSYLEAIERFSVSNDLPTIIILLVLVLLVIAKQFFQPRFEDFLAILSSSKFMLIRNKEHKTLFGFNVLMLLIRLLSISLFIFLIFRVFITLKSTSTEVLFLQIFTGYSFFILLKITIEKIIANVFDIDSLIDVYLFQKHTFRNFISILLLPFSITLVYIAHPDKVIFYIILALLALASVFVFYRIIKKNQGLVSRNWFYFILYLCALEIAPYVILYKLVTIN